MRKVRVKSEYYYVPEVATDINTEQFLKCQQAVTKSEIDELEILSCLTGIHTEALAQITDVGDMQKLKADTECVVHLAEMIRQAKKPHEYEALSGERFKLPKDFAQMNFGQRIALENASKAYDKDKDNVTFVIAATSIFVAPSVHGSGWMDWVEIMKEEIAVQPAIQTIPIFNFFLRTRFSLKTLLVEQWYSLLTRRR